MIKFFFPGLILGALLNLCVFRPAGGAEIYPFWHGSIGAAQNIEKAEGERKDPDFFVKKDNTAFLLGGDGSFLAFADSGTQLASFSADGKFFVKYQKVGNEIEFFSLYPSLERFWKMKSLEYPYLSPHGKIIFLLNSDQSKIRLVDYNGNETGDKSVSGFLCTVIAFSEHADFGAAGFMSGGYFFLNPGGKVICKGTVPTGCVVKGMAVSDSGEYGAVHYGNADGDQVRIIALGDGGYKETKLGEVHRVKSPLSITDEGYTTIVNSKDIVTLTRRANISLKAVISPRRPGLCFTSYQRGLYAIGYTRIEGESRFIVMKEDGTVLYSRVFSGESFMSPVIRGDLIFVRGSDNLFCYRFHQ